MDLATLYYCNMITSAFLGVALLFFRNRQKTYPGFGLWTTSAFLAATGYAATMLRLAGPEYLAVVMSNLCFTFTGVLRLQGMMLFLGGQRMNRAFYVLPFLELAGVSWFLWASNSLAMRVLVLSLSLAFLAWVTASVLFRHSATTNRTLYRVLGGLYVFFMCLLAARVFIILGDPNATLFGSSPVIFRWVYLMATMLIEIAWVLGFLMMNSQRMEEELRSSQDSLARTVDRLENSLAEVKTLSGLLPICAECKNVRNDKGYWQQIEVYLSEHSEADFSHGICPNCMKKLYPELSPEEPGQVP
jgi:hypothetical protein